MLPKIVYIGTYSDPEPIGGNNLLWKQAEEVSLLGYNVEIITSPRLNAWTGELPNHTHNKFMNVPILHCQRKGLSYYVVAFPKQWETEVPNSSDWDAAVKWAKDLLQEIKPQIVHQHSWQKMWFFMEAALQLNIITIYSVYDWGLPCLRKFLIKGDGSLCDSLPSVQVCKTCLLMPNKVKLGLSQDILPSDSQIKLLFSRWKIIANRLAAIIVTSPFASNFYQLVGVKQSIIHEMPWFYSQSPINLPQKKDAVVTRLGFLGRLVPIKGLHFLLETLKTIKIIPKITLEIVGAVNNNYAISLKDNFQYQAGHHDIVWSGWLPNNDLSSFFERIQALIVPSIWYDNSPTVLVEALAHNCPVICTDLPSMTHLIHHNVNGLTFSIGDSQQLAEQLIRFIMEENLSKQLQINAAYSVNSQNYANFLSEIYAANF